MHSLTREDDLVQIRHRLHSVQAEDRALWGVMSAGEMVCHVRGAFRTAMGEIPFTPVPVPMPRAALKAAALWAPVPWRKDFATVPALRQGTPEMRTGEFAADLAGAMAELDRFCRPEQAHVNHAFFGTMSLEDWMRWGYLHTDHHLRQFGR